MTENEQLSKQIAIGLETTTKLIQSLSADVKENTKNIASIQTEIKNLTEDVKSLSKLVKDGNGTPPLITKVAVLEQIVDQSLINESEVENELIQLKSLITASEQRLAVSEQRYSLKKEIKQENLEEIRYKGTNKLQMWVAIISSIVAIGVAILGVVFK